MLIEAKFSLVFDNFRFNIQKSLRIAYLKRSLEFMIFSSQNNLVCKVGRE